MRNIEEGSYIILGEMMLYVIVGIIGAMLMFCGDMTLYYTPEDFDYNAGSDQNKMQAVIDVMKKLPVKRVAAGGAYHSHCAYLGLLGDDKYKEGRDIVLKYFSKLAFILYGGEGIGFLLLIILIFTGNTILPRWLFLLSPGVLFLLKPLVSRLPKGVRVIISGGWSNLISVIYFSAVLIVSLIV